MAPGTPAGHRVNRLIETDDAGRIVYATPEAAALLRMTPRGAVGRNLFRFFPTAHQDVASRLTAAMSGLVPSPFVATLRPPDHGPIAVTLTASKLDGRRVLWRVDLANE